MKRAILTMLSFILFSLLIACSAISPVDASSRAQWDFDHKVQFIQSKIEDNIYQLEIIPTNRTKFRQLSAFLLRKSLELCGGYQYKIQLIQGIEGVDDKRAMPNYITRSLIAKVEC